MKLPMRRKLEEVSKESGVSIDLIIHFIEEQWIQPIDPEMTLLDEEDVARINLIYELTQKMGVNDEAIPIILHLIDQLNVIHLKIKMH